MFNVPVLRLLNSLSLLNFWYKKVKQLEFVPFLVNFNIKKGLIIISFSLSLKSYILPRFNSLHKGCWPLTMYDNNLCQTWFSVPTLIKSYSTLIVNCQLSASKSPSFEMQQTFIIRKIKSNSKHNNEAY